MVKVIELIPTLAYGGAEALVKDYALKCNPERVKISIVTWSGSLGTLNESAPIEAGIDVIHLEELRYPHGKRLNPLQRIHRKICRFIDFRRLVLNEKPDVIHMHLRIGAYMRVIPIKRMGIRLFYTVHNELDRYFDKQLFRKKWFEYLECKRLINRYDMTMLTLHDRMRKEVSQYFNTNNVITLHNGADLTRFDGTRYKGEDYRKSIGLNKDDYVIGHVGSVQKQKNHDFILDMFVTYKKGDKSAKLLLIGKGIDKKRILSRISEMELDESVIFLEGRSDIPELMSTMDVFILPSHWEGYPVVTLEAQGIGLPCVISDKITDECILSNKVAVLPIDGTEQIWSNTIAKIKSGETDELYAKKIGELNDYDIKHCIERLEELYLGEI